jgi:hypothetical protein
MADHAEWVTAILGPMGAEWITEGGTNLVFNPGFEEGQKGWNAVVQSGKYDLTIDRTQAHKGKASAKIACIEPGLCMWRQGIPVEKGKKYYFSLWVKNESNDNGTPMIWLQQGNSPVKGEVLFLNEGQEGEVEGNWEKYAIREFTALEDHLTIILQSHDLYADDDKGAVWFDDIVLRKIGD